MPTPGALVFGELEIDPAGRRVLVDGEEAALTQREFDLLLYLARHPGQAFSREQIMDAVWQHGFWTDTSTVTVHVRRLRHKIESDPTAPDPAGDGLGRGLPVRAVSTPSRCCASARSPSRAARAALGRRSSAAGARPRTGIGSLSAPTALLVRWSSRSASCWRRSPCSRRRWSSAPTTRSSSRWSAASRASSASSPAAGCSRARCDDVDALRDGLVAVGEGRRDVRSRRAVATSWPSSPARPT